MAHETYPYLNDALFVRWFGPPDRGHWRVCDPIECIVINPVAALNRQPTKEECDAYLLVLQSAPLSKGLLEDLAKGT